MPSQEGTWPTRKAVSERDALLEGVDRVLHLARVAANGQPGGSWVKQGRQVLLAHTDHVGQGHCGHLLQEVPARVSVFIFISYVSIFEAIPSHEVTMSASPKSSSAQQMPPLPMCKTEGAEPGRRFISQKGLQTSFLPPHQHIVSPRKTSFRLLAIVCVVPLMQ